MAGLQSTGFAIGTVILFLILYKRLIPLHTLHTLPTLQKLLQTFTNFSYREHLKLRNFSYIFIMDHPSPQVALSKCCAIIHIIQLLHCILQDSKAITVIACIVQAAL